VSIPWAFFRYFRVFWGPEGLLGRAKGEEERALDVGPGQLDPQVAVEAGKKHAGGLKKGAGQE